MKRLNNIWLCVIATGITLLSNSVIAQQWQSGGSPSIGTANVKDLAAGTAAAGQPPTVYNVEGATLYRTTDGGTTWTTAPSPGGTPLAITCKQSTPTWVVTNWTNASSGYVSFSSDNGSTWISTNVQADAHAIAFRMATFPAGQNFMVMGEEKFSTYYSMKRSTDAGQHWYDVSSFFGTIQTDVDAVAPHKTKVNHVFAGGKTPPVRMSSIQINSAEQTPTYTNGAFFSTDTGATWTRYTNTNVNTDIAAMVACKGAGTTYNYVFAATTSGSLYRSYYTSTGSPSAAATWTKQTNFPAGLTVYDLNVDGNSVIYAMTSAGVYKSTNNGTAWTQSKIGMTDVSNMQRVATDPQSVNNVFVGSVTNLYKSSDAGCTWLGVAPTTTILTSSSAVAVNGATWLTVPTSNSAVARNAGPGWTAFGFTQTLDFTGTMIGFKSPDGNVALDVGYHSVAGTASLMRNGSNGNNTCGNAWTEVRSGTYVGGKYNGFVTDPANTDRVYAFGLVNNGNSTTNENYSVGAVGGTSWERNAVPTLTQTNI